jgi:hypothetical protein
MINELSRKISTQDMRAGQGPALLSRLGITLKPVNGLACTCDKGAGRTCRLATPPLTTITRDAQRSDDPRLLVCVLALKNLDERLSRLEQHVANRQSQGMAQGQVPQDIINAAQQKADMHLAQMRAEKIDTTIAESHAKKAEEADRLAHGDPREPGHGRPEQRPKIDMESYKHNAPLDE